MPVKSEPYYFAVCDNCGKVADYGEITAWKDAGQAADVALDSEWTHKGEVFHCPACPPLDNEPADGAEQCAHRDLAGSGEASYIDKIAARIGDLVPGCDIELLRLYALLALVNGVNTTLENVHDAWSTWRAATRPDHPSLVPFAELAPQVQELDRKYADAIRTVAGQS